MKEDYTPARIDVMEFEQEDIIITSNIHSKKKAGFVEYYDLDDVTEE